MNNTDIINILPPTLSDQIAAGEVLERSSSAVKELIENALDANATWIRTEITNGGKNLIRVSDNGSGMSQNDALNCFLRHATSKITKTDDLSAIKTLGFRGEALASMAAVTKFELKTKRKIDPVGFCVKGEASKIIHQSPISTPNGTQILLHNLFYNTPARLKFLKTNLTETRKIQETIEKLALANPQIHFQLFVDDKQKMDFPPRPNLKDRILDVLGPKVYHNIYPIPPANPIHGTYIHGYFGEPNIEFKSQNKQFFFVNGRSVKDKTITAAVNSAYKEFLHGKLPYIILFLTCPLDKVDVNVHPTKHELRFQEQDLVFKTIYNTLKQGLSLTPWINNNENTQPDDDFLVSNLDAWLLNDANETSPQNQTFTPPEQILSKYLDNKPHKNNYNNFNSDNRQQPPYNNPEYNKIQTTQTFQNNNIANNHQPLITQLNTQQLPLNIQNLKPEPFFSSLDFLTQLSDSYLLCKDKENLVIIDQHAAHERINYQKLKDYQSAHQTPPSQTLIFPVLLNLDANLTTIMAESIKLFENLGYQIDPFGEQLFAIKAVPVILQNYNTTELLQDALLEIQEYEHTEKITELTDHILSTMACHKSIRANTKLSHQQAKDLLELMDSTLFRSNCPHGRPVHFIITNDEIQKRFLRK